MVSSYGITWGREIVFFKWLKEEGKKEATAPTLSSSLWKQTKKRTFCFLQSFSSAKCPPNLITKFQSNGKKQRKLNIYQKVYLHIFPFFYISHSLAASYGSCGSYEVSWDDPVRNNNFQYHLKKERQNEQYRQENLHELFTVHRQMSSK